MTIYTENLSFCFILSAIFSAISIGIKLFAPVNKRNEYNNDQIGRLLWDEESIIFLRTQYSPRSLYESQLYDEPRKY
jgi:hypothetical protein